MIRFLTFSVFVVFFLSSCRSYQYLDAVGVRPENAKEVNTFFLDTGVSLIYRAKVVAFSKQINGSILLKTVSPEEHRVAFVNDFGQTLFDMSIFSDGHKSHFIAPELAKKSIEGSLADIFRIVTERRFANSALIFKDKQHYPVYVAGDSYYKLKRNVVDNIVTIKGGREQFVVDFKSPKDAVPEQIEVHHKKYPLTMKLVFERYDQPK